MPTLAPERPQAAENANALAISPGYTGFLRLCQRIGFELEPYQRRIAKALLGPQREALILLPRTNGKSQLNGLLALHELVTHPAPQVYIAATSRDQARIVFEYARDAAVALEIEGLEIRHLELRVPGGFLRVLASDAPKLYGVHPTLAIVDEYHAAKDDSVYVALRSGLRPDAKLWVLSTAGTGADSPLGRLRERALALPDIRHRGCLTDARGDRLRMLEWRVPDDAPIGDMRKAKQANPAPWITAEYLREQREALHELAYRRYHLNQWVGRIGSWLPPGAWQACAADYEIRDGEHIWVGIDIGGTESDSAVVWVTEDLRVGCEIFECEDAVLAVRDLVPELARRYRIREVTADPHRAAQMLREWQEQRIRSTEFPQSDTRMIPASKALYGAITSGKLRHPDDKRLNAHVFNAVAKQSRRGWRLAAGDGNIDGAIALAMAVSKVVDKPPPIKVAVI